MSGTEPDRFANTSGRIVGSSSLFPRPNHVDGDLSLIREGGCRMVLCKDRVETENSGFHSTAFNLCVVAVEAQVDNPCHQSIWKIQLSSNRRHENESWTGRQNSGRV